MAPGHRDRRKFRYPGASPYKNGDIVSTPTIDDLHASDTYVPPGDPPRNGYDDGPSLKFIDADIGEFIKRPKTAIARDYEKKTQSALNAVMRFCAQNPATVPDAAAIIAYGDDFSAAMGEVAEVNAGTRKMIDLILAPESPYLALAIAGIPLITQIFRNHEASLSSLPYRFRQSKTERKANKVERKASRPRISFKLFKREIKVTIPFRVKLGFLVSQTVEPNALANAVFSNEQVVKALKKRGIRVAGKM
jgi:hypothetical protein